MRFCLLHVATQRALPHLSVGGRRIGQAGFETDIRDIGRIHVAVVLRCQIDVDRCRCCRGVRLDLLDLSDLLSDWGSKSGSKGFATCLSICVSVVFWGRSGYIRCNGRKSIVAPAFAGFTEVLRSRLAH